MKKLSSHLLAATSLLALTIAFPVAGRADVRTFTLTDCNDSSGCSPQFGNNFGTVTITDGVAGVVTVDVNLEPNYTWAATGLIGFAWTLATGFTGANTPIVSGLTASWIAGAGGVPLTGFNTDGMGTQQYGVDYTGANSVNTANLDFTLTATGLDVTDFILGGVSPDTGVAYHFLADIATNANGIGGTGLVGDGLSITQQCTDGTCAVPAPIVGAGLPGLVFAAGGLLALARRRRRKTA